MASAVSAPSTGHQPRKWIAAATGQLHAAAASGDPDGVTAALAAGANPCALNREDDTPPLIAAAYGGHTAVVQALLAAGARPAQARPSDGKTALHVAVEEGHDQVVACLLSADPQLVLVADMDGWLPLTWAAYYGDAHVAQQLIAAGHAQQQVAAITSIGESVLQVALQMCGSKWHRSCGRACSYTDLIALLSRHGVDVSGWRDPRSGGTALHTAVQEGGDALLITALVTQLGVPVDATTSISAGGVTALHTAVASGNTAATQALLQSGASTEVQEVELGMTPLLLAAQAGNTDMLQLLLQHKAKSCVVDSQGLTAATLLLLACEEEEAALQPVTCLLHAAQAAPAGATPAASGSNTQAPTALHVAASKGFAQLTQLLCQAAAQGVSQQCLCGSVTSCDARGDTPLHAAVRSARTVGVGAAAAVVSVLHSAGAPVDAQNSAGLTPLQLLRVLLPSDKRSSQGTGSSSTAAQGSGSVAGNVDTTMNVGIASDHVAVDIMAASNDALAQLLQQLSLTE